MLEEAYGVTIAASELQGDVTAALFGVPDAEGELVPLRGEYRAELRMAMADPADALAWVRFVVGGAVFGWLGTDASGRDLAEGLLFGLPIALLIGIVAATSARRSGRGSASSLATRAVARTSSSSAPRTS